MGKVYIPERAKLITGLICGESALFEKAQKALEGIFGRADFKSDILDFNSTRYYEEEFGKDLKRSFMSFERLIDIKDIYKLKLRTNALERRFLKYGKRRINIDPGYLNLGKIVLLSTKDYSHRVYLNKGIFAEATLYYKDATFTAWPWTYPDYQGQDYINVFNAIRQIYKKQLNKV